MTSKKRLQGRLDGVEDGLRYLAFLSSLPMNSCTPEALKVARLDFLGGHLPSLSINYVAKSKDMGKRLPQLYYVKMKISFDLGFIAIGVAMAT